MSCYVGNGYNMMCLRIQKRAWYLETYVYPIRMHHWIFYLLVSDILVFFTLFLDRYSIFKAKFHVILLIISQFNIWFKTVEVKIKLKLFLQLKIHKKIVPKKISKNQSWRSAVSNKKKLNNDVDSRKKCSFFNYHRT